MQNAKKKMKRRGSNINSNENSNEYFWLWIDREHQTQMNSFRRLHRNASNKSALIFTLKIGLSIVRFSDQPDISGKKERRKENRKSITEFDVVKKALKKKNQKENQKYSEKVRNSNNQIFNILSVKIILYCHNSSIHSQN